MKNETTRTDYRTLLDKPYLGSWDIAQLPQPVIMTIQDVTQETVTGDAGKKENCIIARITEGKPMILNRTNCKTLAKLFKSPCIEDWRGPVLLGVEPVRFGGEMVDGLRIKPYLPKLDPSSPVGCVGCGTAVDYDQAQATQRQYGKPLCPACAQREAEKRGTRAAQTGAGQLAAMLGG